MSGAKVNWYSIGLNQKVEEHEPVDLEEAAGIINKYLSYAGQKFKTDKEALAASMFGFSKSKSDFIEICVNGSEQFSYKFEFSASGKPLSRVFRHEEELQSKDELVKKVAEFFNNTSEELAAKYKGAKKQAKSPLRIRAGTPIGNRIFTIVLVSVIGIGILWMTLNSIADGKVLKFHGDEQVSEYVNPIYFWLRIAASLAVGIWLIRGCVLESLIVQKMLRKNKK
jgi:hypothetical protein